LWNLLILDFSVATGRDNDLLSDFEFLTVLNFPVVRVLEAYEIVIVDLGLWLPLLGFPVPHLYFVDDHLLLFSRSGAFQLLANQGGLTFDEQVSVVGCFLLE
jgi:hypothetical protein